MAQFDIRDSLKTYFSDSRIENAVDSLLEGLQGDDQPEMTWEEARNYNQALLMAAQVRADHNEMLLNIWDATFGTATSQNGRRFKVDFEWDHCTPEYMWNNNLTWQSISRYGLEAETSSTSYELTVMHEERMLFMSIDKWDSSLAAYQDFAFDPAQVGTGTRWKSVSDSNNLIARSNSLPLDEFFIDPEHQILELRTAAQEMVDYLAKII